MIYIQSTCTNILERSIFSEHAHSNTIEYSTKFTTQYICYGTFEDDQREGNGLEWNGCSVFVGGGREPLCAVDVNIII